MLSFGFEETEHYDEAETHGALRRWAPDGYVGRAAVLTHCTCKLVGMRGNRGSMPAYRTG